MSDRPMTHILIARACETDPDGLCAQVRIAMYAAPTADDLERCEDNIKNVFVSSFGEEPARVGVAVLPYSEAQDEMGDSDDE